jgi:hypothetical protein
MAGPLVGAVSITDQHGRHFVVCSACQGKGCPACHNKGCVAKFSTHASFRPDVLAHPEPVSGHVNLIRQATNDETERTSGVDLDGDGSIG